MRSAKFIKLDYYCVVLCALRETAAAALLNPFTILFLCCRGCFTRLKIIMVKILFLKKKLIDGVAKRIY